MDELIPWCGAWEEDLDDDADHVHVPECAGPEVEGLFGAEEPEEGGDDEGDCEVAYAVGEPGDDVMKRASSTEIFAP